jgi:uroporphyrinogen-III synthase
MASLRGARVGLFESRLSHELAELVRRLGGTPVVAPAVREVPHQPETAAFLDALLTRRFSVIVFLTGAAAKAVLREAYARGHLVDAVAAIRQATVVCRGPKPTAVVRSYGLQPDILPEKPFTTKELLTAMASLELSGRDVAVVHYGERNVAFSDALRGRGAKLVDACPYEWALPENTTPLRALVGDLAGQVDAVAFTSQIQVRNLFAVAAEMGVGERLAAALNTDVIVAAVGPVCADALKQVGVTPDVQPADPKMGPLLMALADYMELTQEAQDEP